LTNFCRWSLRTDETFATVSFVYYYFEPPRQEEFFRNKFLILFRNCYTGLIGSFGFIKTLHLRTEQHFWAINTQFQRIWIGDKFCKSQEQFTENLPMINDTNTFFRTTKMLNGRHYAQTNNQNNKNTPNHTTKPINYIKTTTFWTMMQTKLYKQASELGLKLSNHTLLHIRRWQPWKEYTSIQLKGQW
jgi:hypothetical protein